MSARPGSTGTLVADAIDAPRRTRLASERTYLARWRSGLAAMAVSLGVGNVIPALMSNRLRWPSVAVGIGLALLGVAFVLYGLARHAAVDRALPRRRVCESRYPHLDGVHCLGAC
jgi:putative membrane protein